LVSLFLSVIKPLQTKLYCYLTFYPRFFPITLDTFILPWGGIIYILLIAGFSCVISCHVAPVHTRHHLKIVAVEILRQRWKELVIAHKLNSLDAIAVRVGLLDTKL
jgi:hypothetical protein